MVIKIDDIYNPEIISTITAKDNAGEVEKIKIINKTTFGIATLRRGNKHLMLIDF